MNRFNVGDRVAWHSDHPSEKITGTVTDIRLNLPRYCSEGTEDRYVVAWDKPASYGMLDDEVPTWTARLTQE